MTTENGNGAKALSTKEQALVNEAKDASMQAAKLLLATELRNALTIAMREDTGTYAKGAVAKFTQNLVNGLVSVNMLTPQDMLYVLQILVAAAFAPPAVVIKERKPREKKADAATK